MSTTPVSVTALLAYAQQGIQANFATQQQVASQDIGVMKKGKEDARAALAELKQRNDQLQAEFAEEENCCGLFDAIDGIFGRDQGDVSEDLAANGVSQQQTAMTVSKAQKDMADARKDLKAGADEFSEAKQGFQEIFQMIDQAAATISKIG